MPQYLEPGARVSERWSPGKCCYGGFAKATSTENPMTETEWRLSSCCRRAARAISCEPSRCRSSSLPGGAGTWTIGPPSGLWCGREISAQGIYPHRELLSSMMPPPSPDGRFEEQNKGYREDRETRGRSREARWPLSVVPEDWRGPLTKNVTNPSIRMCDTAEPWTREQSHWSPSGPGLF